MTVAFDIDNTLWKIRAQQKDQVPDYDLIQVLKWFYNNGNEIVAWSAGGEDYALTIIRKLGLDQMVTIWPKSKNAKTFVDICFDDEQVSLATVNVQVRREYGQ